MMVVSYSRVFYWWPHLCMQFFISSCSSAVGESSVSKFDGPFGGVNLGGNFTGYATSYLFKQEIPLLVGLYSNQTCLPEKHDGVQVLYTRGEKLKNVALRQLVGKIDLVQKRVSVSDDKKQCFDASGQPVRLMYATGNVTCKYRQIIYYYDSKSGFFNFQVRDDVVALRAFYENIVEDEQFPLLTEFFDDNSTTYMRSGCNTDRFDKFPNSCMIKSQTSYYNVTENFQTLYTIDCCCQIAEKCKIRSMPNQTLCPYDTRTYNMEGNNVTIQNGTFETFIPAEAVGFMDNCNVSILVSQLDFSASPTNKTGQLVMQYGGCPTDLKNGPKRNSSCDILTDYTDLKWSFDYKICCVISVPRGIPDFTAMLDKLLFKKPRSKNYGITTRKMSNIISNDFYPCALRRISINQWCFFFFNREINESMNIKQGENFHVLTDSMDSVDYCYSVGGCVIHSRNASSCVNVATTLIVCGCNASWDSYCDYPIYKRIKEDINAVRLHVPYCNVREQNQPEPQMQIDNFFCFEEVRLDNSAGGNSAEETVEFGFYKISESKYKSDVRIPHSQCNVARKQCMFNGESYFCCCRAKLFSKNDANVSFTDMCNTGKLVRQFRALSKIWEPDKLLNTLKDRKMCDGDTSKINVSAVLSTSDMKRIGFEAIVNPMCYFSIPLDGVVSSGADIFTYFYEPVGNLRNNLGVFAVLCESRVWTPDENSKGCACRVVDTSLSRTNNVKELSCCCVAHLALRQKELIFRQRNKFILSGNVS
ncbi:hypothetical protein DdX_00478 [Ditylenchus destructor]|uniref:Uncharacterized protein n=1 Tax=Ditylenchus destructor TaxID=166010 RepID=A0AAD4NIT3_9BILA|nr:hypothetical protein DdX_00478 [Ditylenchus destructor]